MLKFLYALKSYIQHACTHNPGGGWWWGGNPGFHNHIIDYEDLGPKPYPCLRKTGQNNTMTITDPEAILHEIGQIWPKSCYSA